MQKKHVFGSIEGGGTKFVCAVGDSKNIQAETRIPTTTPDETMNQVIAFFKEQEKKVGKLSAIGFACFGPLDPNPESKTYGYILPTPKPHWSNANVVGMLKSAFDIPIAFDTDVNGAALGEWRWGAAQGLHTFIYLTVGTGIGGGAYTQGKILHGLLHPEMGHIFIKHDFEKDPFEGVCPFHKNCFEGLACGVAIEKRWGARGGTLDENHPAWDLEAHYIAQALASYSYMISPQRIILGGGIGSLHHLLPLIQAKTKTYINGYIQSPTILENIESYIVHPGLGNRSGMMGGMALAEMALQND